MKNKNKTVFVCQECGYESNKWLGKCLGCGAWNTLVEETRSDEPKSRGLSLGLNNFEKSVPKKISDIDTEDLPRFSTMSAELDRVLGGGVIPGSIVLIAGDPGVGKSSLTLKTCANIANAKAHQKVLYVTGEESVRQIRLRADRLQALSENLFVVSETNLEKIVACIEETKPEFLIIDSIQTIFRPDIDSAPGSVSQVRECSVELLRIAKTYNIATFLVGHVTKDGALAGPRVLEHIVDTVLFFEGEKNAEYRILRAIKNRFGNTNELGLFEMRECGLVDVPDASKLFLSEKNSSEAGTIIVPILEGTRPLLVEVQSLVASTPFLPPKRTADAVDIKRLQLLLAVLEKRVNIKSIGACDVFVKIAGGIKIDEPAADLGLCLSMASSFANRLPKEKTIVFGEVGLAGEVRAVSHAQIRLKEAARLGFSFAVLPEKNARQFDERFLKEIGMKIFPVATVSDALKVGLPRK